MAEPDILSVFVTENDIVNTTTESNLLLYSVPANTLGTNKVLHVTIHGDYLNNTATTHTVRWRIYYGATEMYEDLGASTIQDAARRPFSVEVYLWARSATNSQGVGGTIILGTAGGATTGIGNLGDDEIWINAPLRGNNASEDSTADKDFKVTVVHDVADTAVSIRRIYAVVELLG